MKKVLFAIVTLVLFAYSASAQSSSEFDHSGQFFVSAQGGCLFTFSDNYASYFDEKCAKDLFNPFGAVTVGYSFNPEWSTRLSVNYGKNDSAYNYKESYDTFGPYEFKSLNVFADAILDLKGIKGITSAFSPKIYGGVGFGYTWDFVENFSIPSDVAYRRWNWYLNDKNYSLAFRFGTILEYDFSNRLGIFGDFCGEFFADNYSGLRPKSSDQKWAKRGYLGFPFDVRGLGSVGVILHF